MTDHRDDHPGGEDADAEVLRKLARALTETGELVPTDEDEVKLAEEQGVEEIELPAGLRTFRGAPEEQPARSTARVEPIQLADHPRWRGRSVLTHIGTMALGAVAAAAALVIAWRADRPETGLGGDPLEPSPSASTSNSADVGPVSLQAGCESCCGGSACKSAKAGLESCPSGRACIGCDIAELADSRYRLRFGAVHLAAFGFEALRLYPGGQAEICVRAGIGEELCEATTLTNERDGGKWTVLPVLLTGDDLSGKLAVRVKWKHVQRESLATAGRWTNPVALTTYSLCSGYVVELRTNDDKEALFGTMSLFLEDAHYVELMRASETATLRDYRKRLQLDGVTVQLHQIAGEGRSFVLAAGPFHKRAAEQLRWQLLEQKQDAKTSYGSDFSGEPMPLP